MKATTTMRTTMMAQVTPAMISAGTLSSAFSWMLGSERRKAVVSRAPEPDAEKTALYSNTLKFFTYRLIQ